jgi:AraC-like DNA-binding protein
MLSHDQGAMTSPTLNAMLVDNIAQSFPGIDDVGQEKTELLNAVMHMYGWCSVFQLGREVRSLTWHPVVKALVACSEPAQIIRRWMSLERFGHSRNRIRLETIDDDGNVITLSLRHVAPEAGKIDAVNDLFMWGLIVGLFEVAGVTGIEASLIPGSAEPFVLHGKAVAPARAPLPSMTDRLSVTGCGPTSSMHTVLLPPINATHSAGERLAALFRRDLLRGWKVGEVSRALAMSQRSLQRTLHDEGTTFTEVLKRTRVECAQTLLEDFRLSLTDIAFCIGFADQSHFTRTFRSFYDVPPSAVRDILAQNRQKTQNSTS